MAGNTGNAYARAFEKTLAEFKKEVRKRDQEIFKLTTLEELGKSIGDLQDKQHSQRRLQNLNRLRPFLEAIEQYGKVVEVFCNNNELVAFIWVSGFPKRESAGRKLISPQGPIKFLLQA